MNIKLKTIAMKLNVLILISLSLSFNTASSKEVTDNIGDFNDYREAILSGEHDKIQAISHAYDTRTGHVTKFKVEEYGSSSQDIIRIYIKHGVLTKEWFELAITKNPSDEVQRKIESSMIRAENKATSHIISNMTTKQKSELVPFRCTFFKKKWYENLFN